MNTDQAGLSRAAHANGLNTTGTDQIAASVASEPVIKAAERLRHECETTEEPNSGFAKDIMTLVEFAEALAAHANECLAPGVSHDHRICEADG